MDDQNNEVLTLVRRAHRPDRPSDHSTAGMGQRTLFPLGLSDPELCVGLAGRMEHGFQEEGGGSILKIPGPDLRNNPLVTL